MSFTNQALGTLGSVAAVSAMSQSVSEQKKANAAKNAEDKQIVDTTKTAIENDQIEAQQAILAHAKDEGLTDEQVNKLKADPSYAQELRETTLKENRINRLKEAGEKYDKYHNNPIDRIYKTGDQLNKAYESFRELNQRIEASRQLKFNLEAAQARLKARGVK